MQEKHDMWVPSLGRGDPLEEEVATHSSILAGKIPWTEEPGELQSKGTQSLTQLSTQGKILTENAIIFHCVVVLFSKVVADVFI